MMSWLNPFACRRHGQLLVGMSDDKKCCFFCLGEIDVKDQKPVPNSDPREIPPLR